MKKAKKLASLAVIFALMFVLTSCGKSAEEKEEDSTKIKIGGLAPLTGDVAVYGTASSKGTKLAFEEANKDGGVLGKQIEFILEDEKGDQNEAVNAYNKLVNNKEVLAIIGDVTSKPAAAVAIESQKDGIPMVAPTATAANVTEAGENVFRACFLDPFQGKTMAKFSKDKLKYTKVAIMYNNADDYSTGLAEAFKQEFEKNGGKIVSYEAYGGDDVDFKAQLTKIKGQDPEALFIPDYYNTVAKIAAQSKDTGLKVTLLGADGWDGVLDKVQSPDLVEGAYFCNHYSPDDTDPKVKDFISNYKAKYNETPNAFAALGYDAGKILIAAIEKAGSTDKDKVIAALKDTEIETVTGKITFDKDRNPIKSVTVLQIKNGKSVFYEKVNP